MSGQRLLGLLSFDTETQDLIADLNNTPLSITDGAFTANAKEVRTAEGVIVTQYLSQSDKRKISVLVDAGEVLDTTIAPKMRPHRCLTLPPLCPVSCR